MAVLYLTDLDGTLLDGRERVTDFTRNALNRLTEEGMLFSYATARSFATASKVTAGVRISVPVILHNGALIFDPVTGKNLRLFGFSSAEAEEIFFSFRAEGLFPVVYAFLDGTGRFSYREESCGMAQREFVLTRRGDERERRISTEKEALDGDVFYFSCIDQRAKLSRVRDRLNRRYRTLFSRDIYTGEWWLEVMSPDVSKANAALVLKEMLGCGRILCFGDQINDISLFEIADESYAVENAAPELKAIATGVIGRNTADGVARFLLDRWGKEENSKILG